MDSAKLKKGDVKIGDLFRLTEEIELKNIEMRWRRCECEESTLHEGMFVVADAPEDRLGSTGEFIELIDVTIEENKQTMISLKHGHLIKFSKINLFGRVGNISSYECIVDDSHANNPFK